MNNLPAAHQYAALGVYIFPCHFIKDDKSCSCDDVNCKSPGKHPIWQLAPNGQDSATNDVDIITSWWTVAPKANIAMSLAPSGLVVIDIDPRNGGNGTFDGLEAKHGRITSDVEQLTGGGGRHIVFVAQAGSRFPGKLGAGVDVKHQGYIMVWPSNHVLGDYEWEGSSDLMTGAIPSMAPDWLALPAGDEFNVDIKPAAPGLGFGAMLPEQEAEIDSALSYVPNELRDDWLLTGMVLHSIDTGQAGFKKWEEWSSTCAKFDAQDQTRVWFSFHGKPNQRNKESLFYWASEFGWVNPMKKVVAPEVQAVVDKVALRLVSNNENTNVTIIQPQPVSAKPFPVGGLDEISAIIGASSYVNYPDASRLAAVQLACLAASRRYVGDNGEGCHVYFGLSSVSVGMIRYTVNALQSLLSQAGMRAMFSSSRKSTASIIHDQLIRRPAHLYCVEDFGKMLQQSKKQFGNGSMEHALDTLGSIYSKSILQIDQDETAIKSKADPENRVVYAPAMSMMGLVSQDQLTILTRASEIGSGLMVNMLLAICNEDTAITNSDPSPIHTPEWLSHQLGTMRGLNFGDKKHDGTFDFTNERGDFPPEQIVVPLPKTATHDAEIMALSDKRSMIPMLHGARVTMRRIAISLAAWNNPMAPVCTSEMMEWSADFVIGHVKSFMDYFGVMEVGEDGKTNTYQKVLQTIIEAGSSGLNRRAIRKGCVEYKKLPDQDARIKLLQLLEDDGEIVERKVGKAEIYVAVKFVKDSGKITKRGNVIEVGHEDGQHGQSKNHANDHAETNAINAHSQTGQHGHGIYSDIIKK